MRGAWRLAWPPLTASLVLASIVVASFAVVADDGTTNSPAKADTAASLNEGDKVDPSGIWDLVLRGVLGSGGTISLIATIITIAVNKDKLMACLGCKKETQTAQDMRIVNADEIGRGHHTTREGMYE